GLGREGEPLDFIANDFHARVIQHETDHLKGEVYLDRMPDMKSLGHLLEWQRYMLAPSREDGTGFVTNCARAFSVSFGAGTLYSLGRERQ
ncbi:MAG: peptide deformylase, partial [Gammaproteobacteria bacterium]